MKQLLCCLLIVGLLLCLCSCSDNTTEITAMKADLLSLMESISSISQALSDASDELASLKAENMELRTEISAISRQLSDLAEQLGGTSYISAESSASYEVRSEPKNQTVSDEAEIGKKSSGSVSETAAISTTDLQRSQPAVESATSEETATVSGSALSRVYVTPTGSRYHLDPNCGKGTYTEATLDEALARGLTPCKKCAGG